MPDKENERQLVTEEGNRDEAEFIVVSLSEERGSRNGIGLAETMLRIGHPMNRSIR